MDNFPAVDFFALVLLTVQMVSFSTRGCPPSWFGPGGDLVDTHHILS